MREWMECVQCFPSQPFVVLTVDQFELGTVVVRLNDRNRIATFIEKLAHRL